MMLMRFAVSKNKGSYDHSSRRAIIQPRQFTPGNFLKDENVMKRPSRLTPRLFATSRGVSVVSYGAIYGLSRGHSQSSLC